jgi:F5/8 type C domain
LWLLAAAGCSFPEYTVQQPPEPVQVETCRDGLMSANEVDVDCGPACDASCATGKLCSADAECLTGFCNQGLCAQPSCNDSTKNRTETDMDCGGSDGCKACTTGQRCASAYDCDGGACTNGRCLAPSCSDGLQNQDESDQDCGGLTGCDRCQTKQHCKGDADCAQANCSQGRCQDVGCDDGVQNGNETGMDCGGGCPSCRDFSGCANSEDCLSLVCSPQAHLCLAATCSDGVQNGSEPTIDCGQDCQKKCDLTQTCAVDADCQSSSCGDDQRCVPKSATGNALQRSGWLLSASATFNQDTPLQKAIDGDPGTHWTSGTGQVPGMWFLIDLRKPTAFFDVELICTSNGDYPRSIRALVSDDGQTFTPITGTVAGEQSLRLNFATARIARFIKLELEQDTGGLWWRIDELWVKQ